MNDSDEVSTSEAHRRQGVDAGRRRVSRYWAAGVVALLLWLLAAPAWAQSAADGFDPNANGAVQSLIVQPDGKVLVGGQFTQIGGQARNYLARFNADGTLDAGFNPDANGIITSLALQPDGKVLVGGGFLQIGGQARNRLARLNADGTPDADFDPSVNNEVYSLAVQPDGKVLVGGYFTQIGGQARNRLARLNADGTPDADFDPDVNNIVHSLAVQPDGKVLAGGRFTQVGGQALNYLVRLNADGTLDADFNATPNNVVWCVAVQPDGKVLAGGYFTQIGGQARNYLARLNANGTLDADFNPDADDNVFSLAMQPDGKVLVGGKFTQIGGQVRRRLARLNADGTLEAGSDPGVNNTVWSLAVEPDGKVLAGGDFTQAGGQARNHIARLNADGTLEAGFDPGANGYVASVAVQPDGKVLLGGAFTQIGGQARNRIARLNADGTVDAGFDPGADGEVDSLAVQPDGKVLVGGPFRQFGGQARGYFARLNADGTLDAGFDPGANGMVFSLAVQSDGKVLVGGQFTQIGGQARSYLARLNADGTLDAGFNPDANSSVYILALQPDGKVLVGGDFTQLGGQARSYLARLKVDGTLDTGFNPDANSSLSSLTVQPDGKVLVGGWFTQIGGQARYRLARFNADGTLEAGFDPGANGTVNSLAMQPDGKVLVGGWFTQIGGQARNRLARLNADGTLDAGFNSDANNAVVSLAVQPDGKVLVGGDFTQIGGQARNRIARLTVPEAALQSLEVGPDRASVAWRRSGSGPELTHAWFERSDDGSAWDPLGAATRIAGGWSLGGLDLPRNRNVWLRARGYASGGNFNGSSSLIESVRLAYLASSAVTAAVQAGQGNVTPATQDVDPGADALFTVRPDAGWRVGVVSGHTCTPVDQGGGTWRAANIHMACAVRVTFEQNPPPTATAQSVSVAFNTAKAITLAGSDSNPGGPFVFTSALAAQPSHGVIDGFNPIAGTLTYTPTLGYSGSDSFEFTVTTANGTSAPATVILAVADSEAVVATPQGVSVAFNTTKAITLGGSDPNPGGPFAYTYALATQPSHGTIGGFNANTGALTYTPTTGYSGADGFTFTAKTVNGTSAAATVALTIAQGEPVEAMPQSVNIVFNTALAITLGANDPNPGAPFEFTYALADAPKHGTLDGFDADTGTLTYTPTPGYSGADRFTFTATTVNGTSAPATVSLKIADGEALVAIEQRVRVPFNTAQGIALGGSDPNPGGPFAFTYALVDVPRHGTLSGFDANTGMLTYVPERGYLGTDSFAFTVGTVNGVSQPATVTLDVTKPQLALSVDDGREFARYRQVIDYRVTLANQGEPASAVPVTFTLSTGFDGDYVHLACLGADAGATCEQDASDPLRFIVTLPSDRSLTWLVSVPVRQDAEEASVDFGVGATGAQPVTDTNVLVTFKDGFDVPYGDGTQDIPVIEGAPARALLDGEALRTIEVPARLPLETASLLVVRDGLREIRVEGRVVAGVDCVRLFERATDGRERVTAWSATHAGAMLVLGSVATQDTLHGASAAAPPRAIVLDGAQAPLVLH